MVKAYFQLKGLERHSVTDGVMSHLVDPVPFSPGSTTGAKKDVKEKIAYGWLAARDTKDEPLNERTRLIHSNVF